MKSTPIKILQVMAGGAVGGAENIFLESVLAFEERPEISQAVVTRNVPQRIQSLKAANIPVWTASFSSWCRYPTKRTIQRAVKTFKPDIIEYWMGRAGSYAVTCDAVNVAWYGGYYNTKKRFSSCQHHIVMTKDIQRHVLEQGVEARHTHVLTSYAEFSKIDTPQPRTELETPEDAPLLLALARLHWKKGLDVFLKSLVDLPECYAWIAGDGPLKNDLVKLAEELGIRQRVRFLGWRHDRERLLAAADICVFPSRYEPFGTVTVDAWASGTPLIAAASAGPASVVKNGENGILIPIDDVRALTDGVRYLLTDQAFAKKLIAGGYKTYQSDFTKQAFQQKAVDIYRQIHASSLT